MPASFLSAAAGGALIGLAVAVLLLGDGLVAGISGIVAGLMRARPGDWAWRFSFVLGLVGGGVVARVINPGSVTGMAVASLPVLAVAGALVGFGTRLSGGCTSGHGVCGVSRLSPRSLVATGVFMAVAAAVVLVMRHGGRS